MYSASSLAPIYLSNPDANPQEKQKRKDAVEAAEKELVEAKTNLKNEKSKMDAEVTSIQPQHRHSSCLVAAPLPASNTIACNITAC